MGCTHEQYFRQDDNPNMLDLTLDAFEHRVLIGEGTYGKVFKAKLKWSKSYEPVYKALKKLKLEEELQGFPITATREINILKMLDHKNIVKLENIIIDESQQAHESNRKV